MSKAVDNRYRTVSRKAAVMLSLLVMGLCALAMWLGLAWVNLYTDKMSGLIESSPDVARVRLVRDFRIIAVTTGLSMWVLAAFLFWYGLKSLRTQSMPPAGSLVIEGQRIRTGQDATLRAKLLLAMSAVLCLFGIVSLLVLWGIPNALLAAGLA